MRIFLQLLLGMIFAFNSFSAEYDRSDDGLRGVLQLSLGGGLYTAGSTQLVSLQPPLSDTYSPNKSTKGLFSGELFAGAQHRLSEDLIGQLGMAAALYSKAQLSGTVWETGDPTFDNFTYRYQIGHAHLALKGVLLTELDPTWRPYVSFTVGAAFNQSSDFSLTPKLFEAIPPAPFKSETMTSFMYTVGLGIQAVLCPDWQIGLGYQLSNWGRSALGLAPGQTTQDQITLNHLYVNELLFNITFMR